MCVSVVWMLFGDGCMMLMFVLWVSYFCMLIVFYFLLNWLLLLMVVCGFDCVYVGFV